MATRRSFFTQTEITRAVKGALNAGLTIARVIATEKGVEVVTVDGAAQDAVNGNDWDRGNAAD